MAETVVYPVMSYNGNVCIQHPQMKEPPSPRLGKGGSFVSFHRPLAAFAQFNRSLGISP